MGPSCAQRSRSGVAMTHNGRLDLKELGPGLPLTALSPCATAPNSERACMTLDLSRTWFCLERCSARDVAPGPVSGERQWGTVLSQGFAASRQCVTSGTPDWCADGGIATWITIGPGAQDGCECRKTQGF